MSGLKELDAPKFRGLKDEDVSAVALADPWLILGADEGATLAVLKAKARAGRYEFSHEIPLLDSPSREIDIEGIARDGDHLYVTGSHSLVRKRLIGKRTYEENLQRLRDVQPVPGAPNVRDAIFRVSFDQSTGAAARPVPEQINIRELLQNDDILGPFTRIPSKENGVDIEGIAVDRGAVFLGFRGPVLRSNYVPVMIFQFNTPSAYRLRFVDLGGSGIRDINRVTDGFLLMIGPVGDGRGAYRLVHWDGREGIPGKNRDEGRVTTLGKIPTADGAKAEGFTVTKESVTDRATSYEILVVYDGVPGGGPRRFAVTKKSV